jgi:hypothetical protein
MKLVHWERGGYVVYYRRLEQGRVSHKLFEKEGVGFRSLRWDELVLFPEGIRLYCRQIPLPYPRIQAGRPIQSHRRGNRYFEHQPLDTCPGR